MTPTRGIKHEEQRYPLAAVPGSQGPGCGYCRLHLLAWWRYPSFRATPGRGRTFLSCPRRMGPRRIRVRSEGLPAMVCADSRAIFDSVAHLDLELQPSPTRSCIKI